MPLWDCGVDSLGGRENVEAGMKELCAFTQSHPNATKSGNIV